MKKAEGGRQKFKMQGPEGRAGKSPGGFPQRAVRFIVNTLCRPCVQRLTV